MDKSYQCPVCRSAKVVTLQRYNEHGHAIFKEVSPYEARDYGEDIVKVHCGGCGLLFHYESV